MTTPTDPGNFATLWNDLGGQLQLLAVSGVSGAIFRALLAPEKRWRRRLIQAFAGGMSAIFIGGVVASVINSVTDTGAYAYLAAGFIMGSGGELAVKAIQDRFLGGQKKE